MCKLVTVCERCHNNSVTTSARVCRNPDPTGNPCTNRTISVDPDNFRREGYTPQSQRRPLLCKTCRHPIHHSDHRESPLTSARGSSSLSHHSSASLQSSFASKHPPFRGHPSISNYVSSRSTTVSSSGSSSTEMNRTHRDSHRDRPHSGTQVDAQSSGTALFYDRSRNIPPVHSEPRKPDARSYSSTKVTAYSQNRSHHFGVDSSQRHSSTQHSGGTYQSSSESDESSTEQPTKYQ